MSEEPKPGAGWIRLSGIGFELFAAIAGGALAGYWWDRHFGSRPWGLLIGVGLGLFGGMYNLIRQSFLASRQAGRGIKNKKGDHAG